MDTETVRVTWTTDVEVKLGTLDRDIAQSVAEGYFQPRIANGEPDSACVFKVDGREVDLSTPRTLQLDLAEASERGAGRVPVHRRQRRSRRLRRLQDVVGHCPEKPDR